MCERRDEFRMEDEDDNNNMEMDDSIGGEVDDDEEDLDDEDDDDGMNDDQNSELAASTVQSTSSAPASTGEEDAAIARRRAIQQIMADKSLSEEDKRFRIQGLMSQNRLQVVPPSVPILPTPEASAACVHYERNCTIIAPCCGRTFGCRICHDELSAPGHPPMNRFELREIICKNCNTRQEHSNQCINCQTIFAEYYCDICKIWMSRVCRLDGLSIYFGMYRSESHNCSF
jgi:CHY zinc finger